MLTSLYISNYALIEELHLDLASGFSVITGETGAGKSIILGALGLLQGNRADARAIKHGAKKCIVEGTFNTAGLGVESLLREADIDRDGDQVIIRRELTVAGKSRTFINDTPATLSTLRELSTLLIDIHSQHQNLLLSHETFLLDTLDCMASNTQLISAYTDSFKAYAVAEKQLRQLRSEAQQTAADRDFMAFQLAQLEEAQLQENEQEQLEEESRVLSHAEEIRQGFATAAATLQNDENDVLAQLRSAASALNDVGRYQSEASPLAERINSVRIELDDVLSDIERVAEDVEFDPKRMAFVDERLSTLYTLQKKHRVNSVAELLSIASDLERKLDAIDNADEHIAESERAYALAKKRVKSCGESLSNSRKAAAKQLESDLADSLRTLGMPNLQLQFEFTARQQPERSGLDALRLLFSANKKGTLQDVAQTASGGEIARLMLSLKALIAQKRKLPTIIFDEIDTGVSGTMAERMGRVMQQMAKSAQVLCITHLPQIAALGAEHYWVHKQENDDGTLSQISALDDDQRVREIANMLSGAAITETSLANARELLETRIKT